MKTSRALINQSVADRAIKRIKELVEQSVFTYAEMASILNKEGHRTSRAQLWGDGNLRQVIHRLRTRQSSWYALSAKRANFNAAVV